MDNYNLSNIKYWYTRSINKNNLNVNIKNLISNMHISNSNVKYYTHRLYEHQIVLFKCINQIISNNKFKLLIKLSHYNEIFFYSFLIISVGLGSLFIIANTFLQDVSVLGHF